LLEILVLTVIENWIVDYYAIDGIVMVCGYNSIFELFAVNFAEFELETTLPWELVSFKVRRY